MTTKRLKLKYWVSTSIYVFAFSLIVMSLVFVSKTLKQTMEGDVLSYVFKDFIKNDVPVINITNEEIIRPFDDAKVIVNKNYYDRSSDSTVQENSLIYFENTYMPNTGILYSSDEPFDIKAVLDGTVTDVKEDELLGTVIEITHKNNLMTKYYSVSEVIPKIGSTVKQGDIICKSGKNNISSESDNMLLFEVQKDGININPETFYQMSIDELN